METPEFFAYPKMARLSRECVITEKIDGTNACVYVSDDGDVIAGKRTSWITPERDNFGFAAWVRDHTSELRELGPGRHFGEWWGAGIQRRYGLSEKGFSLFRVDKWSDSRPACCHVVPVLYRGIFTTDAVNETLSALARSGSAAAPGFMKPEGVVVFHMAAGIGFKKTIDGDEVPKSLAGAA